MEGSVIRHSVYDIYLSPFCVCMCVHIHISAHAGKAGVDASFIVICPPAQVLDGDLSKSPEFKNFPSKCSSANHQYQICVPPHLVFLLFLYFFIYLFYFRDALYQNSGSYIAKLSLTHQAIFFDPRYFFNRSITIYTIFVY